MRRLIGLVLVLAAGCGGGGADSSPLPPPALTLVVRLDGQPGGRLNVQLVGADGKAVAGGSTSDAGRADIRATTPPPPGTYKVLVTDLGAAEDNPMEVSKAPAKSRVPASYGKPATTPLSLTVEAGKTEYPLEVKSKG